LMELLNQDRDDWIARRAYDLWEHAGRPFGHEADHWDQASIEYDLANPLPAKKAVTDEGSRRLTILR